MVSSNATTTTNHCYYYHETLIREWTGLCQQFTTVHTATAATSITGDSSNDNNNNNVDQNSLALGGLGPWVYLPYQRAKLLLDQLPRPLLDETTNHNHDD